jgi:hypothetical protein
MMLCIGDVGTVVSNENELRQSLEYGESRRSYGYMSAKVTSQSLIISE